MRIRLYKSPAVIAGIACLAILFVAKLRTTGGKTSSDADEVRENIRLRPAIAYAPTTRPHRHVERPVMPSSVSCGEADDGALDDADGGAGLEDEVPDGSSGLLPPPIAPDDPDLAKLSEDGHFATLVWESMQEDIERIVEEGRAWLASDSAESRALGGVVLFLAGALDGDLANYLAGDPDPMVPLTVCDWIRDFGTDMDVELFKTALRERGLSADDLLALALASGTAIGGGRSALDLYLADFDGESTPAEGLAALVASPDVAYDVRSQALLKLLEPETREKGLVALGQFSSGIEEKPDGLLYQFADKMRDFAEVSNADGDDCKIWDTESPVVFFLSEAEGGMPVRDMANYLEYGLRRDDAEVDPVIEEGTWEFANEFFERMQQIADTLPPEEQEALDRIAAYLDRLVEYDPAFNPFETLEDGEDPESEFINDDDVEDDGADENDEDADVEEDDADENDEDGDVEDDATDENDEDDEE